MEPPIRPSQKDGLLEDLKLSLSSISLEIEKIKDQPDPLQGNSRIDPYKLRYPDGTFVLAQMLLQKAALIEAIDKIVAEQVRFELNVRAYDAEIRSAVFGQPPRNT